jgi:ribonuclease Z
VGAEVEVHEFDYRQVATVYDQRGVVIKLSRGPYLRRSRELSGEWNGLTFVFSGDTTPSGSLSTTAQGADLLIHECFNTVKQLIERSGYDEECARYRHDGAHGAGGRAGARPGEASSRCGLSFLQRFRYRTRIERDIPQAPWSLALAQDLMVFSVTPRDVHTRLAIRHTRVAGQGTP